MLLKVVSLVVVLLLLSIALYAYAYRNAREGSPSSTPAVPSTQWTEAISPDEAALFQHALDTIEAAQKKAAADTGGPIARGFHTKPHGAMLAEFRVLEDLPEFAKYGIFKQPGTYPVWIRFSNGSGLSNSDGKPDLRGLALKLIGSPAPRLLEEDGDARTQDLIFLNSAAGAACDLSQYLAFQAAASASEGLFRSLYDQLGLLETLRMMLYVATDLLPPVSSLTTLDYNSVGPVTMGPYAAKFGLKPVSPPSPVAYKPSQADFLRDDLKARLKAGDLRFDFTVQFFVDEALTPLGNARAVWYGRDSAPVKIGELLVKSRDLDSPRAMAELAFGQRLSFNPWHGSKELRPLGSIQRVRRVLYAASAKRRDARPEPDGTEKLD